MEKNDIPSSEHRGQWTHQLDFLLSCLGYAVGLGNIWRFPYLCYRNGGGAFLIPYAIMLGLCGLPVFYLEIILGQYHGRGPNIVFKNLASAFEGIGYAMIVVTFLVFLYYNMIIAWTIFYLTASFRKELGWNLCGNPWNTQNCFNLDQTIECERKQMTFWNKSCVDIQTFCKGHHATAVNETHCIINNGTFFSSRNPPNRVIPSEEYFLHYVLEISPSFEEFGGISWKLTLSILVAWIIVALCLIKGVKSSGKVVYFTAIFPYVILIILLIRGATLDGALEGIKFYVIPDWNKLMSVPVWADAATQIFYSLGPGFGNLMTLSSYNEFNNNCYRDTLFVSLSNCGTSVFAGFIIFSILGFSAHALNLPVGEVVKSGPGLAFVAYPEAVTKMPISPLWSILFFAMLITLGLDSQFAMCETVITGVHDQWPKLRPYKSYIAIVLSACSFLLSLSFCAKGGVYLFTIMDYYASSYPLLVISLFELILVSWIYGIDRFSNITEEMIGRRPNVYWIVCWKYLTPLTIIGIILFSSITDTPAKFGEYEFPAWAIIMGWLMALSSVIMIPIFGFYRMCKIYQSKESLLSGFRPSEKWGPAVVMPAAVSSGSTESSKSDN